MIIKSRKSGNTKVPSPCRQNWMLCSLSHCQDITVHKYKIEIVPFAFQGTQHGQR